MSTDTNAATDHDPRLPRAVEAPVEQTLDLRPFHPGDEAHLEDLLDSTSGYAVRVTGLPPGPSDALSTLIGRPEGSHPEDKVVLGGWIGEELVSVVDVIRRHPDPDTATVGLLLVRETRRRQGWGTATMRRLAAYAADWPQLRTWRLAVIDVARESTPFWESLGFAPTGQSAPYAYADVRSHTRIFACPQARLAG